MPHLVSRLVIALFTLASFSLSTTLYAADSCNALLTMGIYNISQSSSASDGRTMAKSNFCSYDYSSSSITSSQQATIKASWGWFEPSGSVSGSVTDSQIIQTQKNVCTSGFNSSVYSNSASNYSYAINQDALAAWSKCNELAATAALKFEAQADNTMQGVVVSLSTSAGTTGKFIGVTQIGSGTSVCSAVDGTGKMISVVGNTAASLSSAKKFTITCRRKMKVDAIGNLFADAQTLYFNTSAGSYQVPFAKIGALARSTVDQVKGEIRNAVTADTQASLVTVSQNIAQVETRIAAAETANNSQGLQLASLTEKKTLQQYYDMLPTGFKIPANWNGNWTGNVFTCPTGFTVEGQHSDCGGCSNGATWYVCVKN